MTELAQLKFPGLYLITDHDRKTDQQLTADVAKALQHGVQVIQYRDKSNDPAKRLRQAQALRQLTQAQGSLLIINDDIALAEACSADGVHLGREDGLIKTARQRLGTQAIIGVSCYNDIQRAMMASEQQASYLAFGRFFASSTKPDAAQAGLSLIQQARDFTSLPLVAIGGITPDNAAPLLEAGIDLLAVVKAVFDQSDIDRAILAFKEKIETYR